MSRVRIKFCGVTKVADALAAAECGADAIGLIFVPTSPRCLDVARATQITAALPALVTRVALFRDAESAEVRDVLNRVAIDVLQFHGNESPAYCAQFGRPWLKAVAMGAITEADALARYLDQHRAASGFVFDSHGGARSGGSGHAFDWSRLPRDRVKPLILAGGLHPQNVREAIIAVRPWAVDVSSGIESAPGIKDHAKMRAFADEVSRARTD